MGGLDLPTPRPPAPRPLSSRLALRWAACIRILILISVRQSSPHCRKIGSGGGIRDGEVYAEIMLAKPGRAITGPLHARELTL